MNSSKSDRFWVGLYSPSLSFSLSLFLSLSQSLSVSLSLSQSLSVSLCSVLAKRSLVAIRTTTPVPRYLSNAMGTPDIVIASMQLCVRCIAIAAPNGRAQSYKFHVAGVTTCPVRPRADNVDPLVISLAETAAIRCDQPGIEKSKTTEWVSFWLLPFSCFVSLWVWFIAPLFLPFWYCVICVLAKKALPSCATPEGAQRKVLPGVGHAFFDDVDNVNLLSLLTSAGIIQSLTRAT